MCKYLETNWGGKKGMTSFLSRSYELMLHDAHSEGLWPRACGRTSLWPVTLQLIRVEQMASFGSRWMIVSICTSLPSEMMPVFSDLRFCCLTQIQCRRSDLLPRAEGFLIQTRKQQQVHLLPCMLKLAAGPTRALLAEGASAVKNTTGSEGVPRFKFPLQIFKNK